MHLDIHYIQACSKYYGYKIAKNNLHLEKEGIITNKRIVMRIDAVNRDTSPTQAVVPPFYNSRLQEVCYHFELL